MTLDTLRRVPPPEVAPDVSGVLWTRGRRVRWTGKSPTVPGRYWVRPIAYRFNVDIIHVKQSDLDDRAWKYFCRDLEWGDRPEPRPLEPDEPDTDEQNRVAHALPVDDDEPCEDCHRSFPWWLYGSLGIAELAMCFVVVALIMNH